MKTFIKLAGFTFLIALFQPLYAAPAIAKTYTVDPTIKGEQIIACKAPVEREDGTPLKIGEIKKYTFYIGKNADDLREDVDMPGCRIVVDLTEVPDGEYYYAVTATDTDDRESVYSDQIKMVVKRIKKPKAPTWL